MLTNNPLDDLPQRTSDHANSDLARLKFRQLFTGPLFLVREETDNDYGVDIVIEALINDGRTPTNIRAHVQLKASNKDSNKDGSYSYSVSRRNLNYLLNLPGSFYAFYSVQNDTFYYRSADDVYKELEQKNPNWKNQNTIAIRFTDILNPASILNIHSELVSTAISLKRLRLQLKQQGITQNTVDMISQYGKTVPAPKNPHDVAGYIILGIRNSAYHQLVSLFSDKAFTGRVTPDNDQWEEVEFDDLSEMGEVFNTLNAVVSKAEAAEKSGQNRQGIFELAWKEAAISRLSSYKFSQEQQNNEVRDSAISYAVWGVHPDYVGIVQILRPKYILKELGLIDRNRYEVLFKDIRVVPLVLSKIDTIIKDSQGDAKLIQKAIFEALSRFRILGTI